RVWPGPTFSRHFAAAVVRPRVLRRGSRHAGAVGTAKASGCQWPLSILPQSHVRRRRTHSAWMGRPVLVPVVAGLCGNRHGRVLSKGRIGRRTMGGANLREPMVLL